MGQSRGIRTIACPSAASPPWGAPIGGWRGGGSWRATDGRSTCGSALAQDLQVYARDTFQSGLCGHWTRIKYPVTYRKSGIIRKTGEDCAGTHAAGGEATKQGRTPRDARPTHPESACQLRFRVPGPIACGTVAGGPEGLSLGVEQQCDDGAVAAPSWKIGVVRGECALELVQHREGRTHGWEGQA